MTTNETGEPESSADARLSQLDKILDEYEAGLGLPGMGFPEVEQEAQRLLTLSPAVLVKMTAVQCGEAAYCLRQFGFHLQRATNREQGRVSWAEESIKKAIAKSINQYKGVSFDERKMQAVRDNDAASKLDSIRVHAKLRLERVSHLAIRVSEMAKSLESLQFSKKGER